MAREAKPWYRESKGVWYATVRGRQVSLRVRGRGQRREALAAWLRLLGDGPPTEPATVGGAVVREAATVRELVRLFLDDAGGRLASTTLIWYRHALTRLADRYGDRPVASLAAAELTAWLGASGWSDTSRHHVVGVLNVAFRWGVRSGLTDANPAEHVRKPPKRSRGEEAVVSPADYQSLLSAAPPALGDVLRVLHGTGARPGEVIGMTAGDFDPLAGVVRPPRHKTSYRGKVRTIYLTAELVSLLKGLSGRHATGPLLRNSRGRPWTKDALVLAMRRLSRRTGVRVTAYHLRHSFATDALAAGIPDAHVAELLGHCGTAVLHRVYAHLGTKARVLKDALAAVR